MDLMKHEGVISDLLKFAAWGRGIEEVNMHHRLSRIIASGQTRMVHRSALPTKYWADQSIGAS